MSECLSPIADGFGTYPLVEENGVWYWLDETGEISTESYTSEVEAAFALGKYCCYIENF